MALGITRDRPRMAIEARVVEDIAAWERQWRAERGMLRWVGQCDVTGGFPGFVARGGRLEGVPCRITDRYLLVDEERPHGFGLPLTWICDVQQVELATRAEAALGLRYRDGHTIRAFTLRFRGTRFSLRAARRAAHAQVVLESTGVERRASEEPAEPQLAIPWEASRHYESEGVVWTGRVTAPIGPGLERGACDIWLTTASLIWGSGIGQGLHRLPLDHVQDVVPAQLEDRMGTPAVSIGFVDEMATRHDVIVLFDRQGHGERNLRERGAFVAGLRARGVTLGTGAAPVQPWRLGGWPMRTPVTRPMVASEPFALTEAIPAAAANGQDDAVVRSLPAHAPTDASACSQPPSDALPCACSYEASALAALANLLRAIDERAAGLAMAPLMVDLPPAALQAEAMAELSEGTASGTISPEEARSRKERLLALAEVGPRLQALVELRDTGYLSDDDLSQKRRAIVVHLSGLIASHERLTMSRVRELTEAD